MKIKYLLAVIVSTFTITSTFADNLTQNFPDGANLMNVENAANLDAKFVSSKKMYQISDSKSIIKMFNLTLVVNGQSNIDKSKEGVLIVSNGTVRDYLNILGNQFGYYWTLNGSNVVFSPINPVISQPLPTQYNTPTQPKIIPLVKVAKTTPTNNLLIESEVESNNVLAVKNEENIQVKSNSTQPQQNVTPVVAVKVVESSTVVKTPTSPLISSNTIIPNKNYGVWEMKISDKTVKKTFQRWAKDAGWQLIWNANIDYPISAGMSIEGDFDYAVDEVCRASQFTDNKIIGEFHPKNKVIVITTQD